MYYVDMDMLEDAKEVMESSIKLQSNFFEEDDKNVLYINIDAKRMVIIKSFITQDLQCQ